MPSSFQSLEWSASSDRSSESLLTTPSRPKSWVRVPQYSLGTGDSLGTGEYWSSRQGTAGILCLGCRTSSWSIAPGRSGSRALDMGNGWSSYQSRTSALCSHKGEGNFVPGRLYPHLTTSTERGGTPARDGGRLVLPRHPRHDGVGSGGPARRGCRAVLRA